MSSVDKKPKFEPDPPPDTTGLSQEEALQRYVQWQQMQLDRIADWWPKENESRLNRLEQFVPALGTWPIVDYSYVLATVSEYFTGSLSCGQGDLFVVESEDGYALDPFVKYFDYSPENDTLLIVGGSPTDDDFANVALVDATTGNVLWTQNQSPRSGGRFVSSLGSITDKAYIFVSWWVTPGIASSRLFYYRQHDNPSQIDGTYNAGINNFEVISESEGTILLFGDASPRFVSKSTFTATSVAPPSGYGIGSAEFAIYVNSKYLASANKTADSGVSFTTITPGDTSWGTPTDVGDIDGNGIFTECVSEPRLINGQIWWMLTRGANPSYRTMFVITNNVGQVQDYKPVYFGDTSRLPQSSSAEQLFSYSSETNSVYYNYNNEFWQYNISTDSYSQCTPSLPSGLSGNIRIGGSKIVGQYMWSILYDLNAINSGWGLERVDSQV